MPSILLGDNLPLLESMASGSVHLVYTDPPFNTGRCQQHTALRTIQDPHGDRTGFGGKRYRTERGSTQAYPDTFDDYRAFIEPRLRQLHRVLTPNGSLFLHLDFREAHRCKLLLDDIFGPASFINEIIWAYDFGGRPKNRWPTKHDTILWYAKDPAHYTFNYDEIDRIPYMAPGLVGPEKAARGKTPTDVWWHTIVPTGGRERTGYPTQKPLGIVSRIVRVHSNPGEMVLDCFAGSGTAGEAAAQAGRDYILIDSSPEAVRVMRQRLSNVQEVVESAAGVDESAAPTRRSPSGSPFDRSP